MARNSKIGKLGKNVYKERKQKESKSEFTRYYNFNGKILQFTKCSKQWVLNKTDQRMKHLRYIRYEWRPTRQRVESYNLSLKVLDNF